MIKKLLLPLGLIIILTGCLALEPIQKREAVYGKNTPVITQSFASKELRIRDTWKVYLNAQDPDGDMKSIECTISQRGMGTYPASAIWIKKENSKELSGYIYLNTLNTPEQLYLQDIVLTVQIRDKAGHFSEPAVFPLEFNRLATQEPPPQGIFKENDLGPIMIQLHGDEHKDQSNIFLN
jgi:hypothetical protein